MTEPLDMRAARRRYVTACGLFWLAAGLTIAPLILLFTERGLSLAAIAGLFAAHSFTAAGLELPTGGLSDVLGRRTVLAAAGLLNLAALMVVGLGVAPWVLTCGMVLMGAGRALSSGPAEAWYVDLAQAHSGPGADLHTGLARGKTATSAALATGTLLGGALPWLLTTGPQVGRWLTEATSDLVVPLSIPLLLAAAIEIVFVLYVLTALREQPRPAATVRGVLRGIPVTIAGGLRLGARDGLVRRVLLSAGAAGGTLAAVELLSPGRVAALTGASESGAVVFASLACAGFLCSGLGSHLAPLAARLTGGGERAVLAGLGTSACGLLLLGVTAASTAAPATILAVTGYALVYLGRGCAAPSENDLLHRRVTRAGRATALSVQSLALQLAGVLTGLLIGVLPPGPVPWLLAGTMSATGALLWSHRGTSSPATATVTSPHTTTVPPGQSTDAPSPA
ncbi:MFS transporter [Sphaerisporangium rhizosphaerae]|uniref:MFS transporter n=1 Tax=Sphaerisporangium rhizosphaerae TaxID=2269375 RepID=A0ABW2P638_9ACTN